MPKPIVNAKSTKSVSRVEAETKVPSTAFLTNIVKNMNSVFNDTVRESPDSQHNSGRLLAFVYFWDTAAAIAKGRSAKAWEALTANKLIDEKERDPGEYDLTESPHFLCTLKVSEKVRRFDPQVLAEALLKKYKVPIPITKQMVEAAKVPSKSTNTYRIVEKSV